MATIEGVTGLQYVRSADPIKQQAYQNNNYQYATSTHQFDHDMNPALIVQPKNDNDIVTAVKYAKTNKISIAIKSGGHQYSGASSTSGNNIVIDLRLTFRDTTKDLIVLPEGGGKKFVYASVSWSLGEFNGFLKQNGLFVPHGQCTHVHVGGHGQTGGYGQLGRSFGLLGDYIRAIRFIDHDANIREIDRGSDPDLFWGILGGSPGNFGVITHYTIDAQQDINHTFPKNEQDWGGPRGLKAIYFYDPDTAKALIAQVAAMSDNLDMPRNYDLCVSVLSSSFPMLDLIPELDGIMKKEHPEIFGFDGIPFWPSTIVLYAQWVPFSKDDRYDPKWFQTLEDITQKRIWHWDLREPMSKMTGEWIFRNVREFDHPYVKRTYLTTSTTLTKDKWVDQVVGQIDKVVNKKHFFSPDPLYHQCWLSCQIQNFGGKLSKFHTNADNGTSYSWRDSTMCFTLDCFHESMFREVAEKYQADNDKLFIGPTSSFSKQDRRVLWGSWGDWDMSKVWQCYYDDKAKYEKLGKVRTKADPDGTFTANPFAVQRV